MMDIDDEGSRFLKSCCESPSPDVSPPLPASVVSRPLVELSTPVSTVLVEPSTPDPTVPVELSTPAFCVVDVFDAVVVCAAELD